MADNAEQEAIPPDIQAMSFEQALAALDGIVQQLEAGEVDLERSIEIYTRGTLLKRHCEAKLRAAQERIEKITIAPNGGVAAEPWKPD